MFHMISLSCGARLIALPARLPLGTERVEVQWTTLPYFNPRWPCNDVHHALGRRQTSMRPCLLRLQGWSGGTIGEMCLPLPQPTQFFHSKNYSNWGEQLLSPCILTPCLLSCPVSVN